MGNSLSMSGHQKAYQGETDVWLTPPHIISALGPFDLDPCSPSDRPWKTAVRHLTVEDDGLACNWSGFCWVNPPYGPETGKWLEKLANHGNGIALIFARTETSMFFNQVWNRASSLLFIEGRLHFHRPCGSRAKANSGAPSVLVGYGNEADKRLEKCGISGKFLKL